jgi:phytoene dehydrogenase-like protein
MAHDVAVVGGGHNGLICAAYLARAGLDVVVLESRDEVGGCASTVRVLGARANTCNCDHLSIRTTPILDELELGRHGLEYLDVDPAQLSLLWGSGSPWFLFHDVDRTIESLRLSYRSEVEGYRRYVEAALPVARLLFELALGVLTRRRLLALAARSPAAAARAVAWSRMSAKGVLRSFFRDDALVAPAGVIGPVIWGLAPSATGTGLGALGYAVRHLVHVGRPAGGSGELPAAIAAALSAAGGTVRTSSRVDAIVADRSRVRGVRLESGEVLEAGAVVVACDPRRAFVEWLREPPAGAAPLVHRWRGLSPGEGYQSKVDAVVPEPPRYSSLDDDLTDTLGVDNALLPTTIVAPGGSGLDEAAETMRAGHVAERPPAMVNVPSVADPAMRTPSGEHMLSLEVLFTPYALAGGWTGSAEPERWLGALGGLAQDGFLECVGARRAITPVEWERDFSMNRGHALAFGRSPLALLAGRDPELTRYETPVPGLFLTGAATFPGAGIWGASGRNAASVVLRLTQK